MPLLAMKAFVEQLKKKGINNKQVTGISHAGSNVALLLDTMMDLSNIESGKITAKEDCFDFYGFLQRTESILKASNAYGGSLFFTLSPLNLDTANSNEQVFHAQSHDELTTDSTALAFIEEIY